MEDRQCLLHGQRFATPVRSPVRRRPLELHCAAFKTKAASPGSPRRSAVPPTPTTSSAGARPGSAVGRLADALDNRVEFGVWGGMTERQRRALLKAHPEVTSWREYFEAQRKQRDVS